MNKVSYAAPDFKELAKEYMCIDMHFHSIYSDGAALPRQIIRKLGEKGFGCAITDHNLIGGALKVRSMAGKENVIPGIELKIKGDIDFLLHFYDTAELQKFYDKEFLPRKIGHWAISQADMTYAELARIAKNYRCLLSFAHPSKYKKDLKEKIMREVQAIEVINGCSPAWGNFQSRSYAEEMGKPMIAGSDGHSIYELGQCVTCCKAKTIAEFLDAVKKGRTFVVGDTLPFGKPQRYFNNIINRFADLVPF
jgi:predicted metal-dependent phosphoesterase TrpH